MISNQIVKYVIFCISILIIGTTVTSCGLLSSSDDDDDSIELIDGLAPDIWEVVDEELLSIFEDSLNVPVHRGANPPNLVAGLSGEPKKRLSSDGVAVVMRPFLMYETLVPDDRCENNGCNFYDMFIRLNNQDFDNNEVTTTMRHIDEPTIIPTSGLISGNGDNFSIFIEQIQDYDGDIVKAVSLYSGKVTPEGIAEPRLAFVMVDNADLDGKIPNGTGRSFKDGDDLAEITVWPEEEAQKMKGQNEAKYQISLDHIK